MISVEEANQIISERTQDFGTEMIDLENGIGRVLREDIFADRDFPPYDRVTMDGIAIRYDAFDKGRKEFEIAGIAAAGDEKHSLREKGKCLEVMTGAILPDGLDTVIPYEHIEIVNGNAHIKKDVNYKQNIHFKGLDRHKGDKIIESGQRLSPAEIGVCATVGKSELLVSRLPKTIIISTGHELVNIDEQPKAHQIRRSNVYRIQAALKNHHIDASTAHINDDYDSIVKKLRSFLQDYELIILSGGISKGKFDFLPKALEELQVEKHFHKVAQRPGKPFWFGSYNDKVTVFAFPGNPISSFMCLQQYFAQWIDKCLKTKSGAQLKAKLGEAVEFKPDMTYFLQVKLEYNDKAEIIGMPNKGNGSGDLANLVDADSFIVLPRGRDKFKKGEVFPIVKYRGC
jgi:molybdopterin molybdotransferase